MMRLAALAAATTLLAGSAFADRGLFDDDDCRYKAPRRVAAPAAGVTKVVIHAESGSLRVEGMPGVSQIVADGTACTSDEDFLGRMTLTTRRQGSELHISATIPDKSVVFGFFRAQLDFSVTLPQGMPVTINDDSGWIKVSNTGALSIDDDSGAIEVKNVRGPVTITDDSGSIELDTIMGNVTIEDDSGEITIRSVHGNVDISDDSGAISVAKVQGSVRIREDDSGAIAVKDVIGDVIIDDDGSGGIQVADVTGRFHVGHKSAGGIEYVRVAGRVTIPEKHR